MARLRFLDRIGNEHPDRARAGTGKLGYLLALFDDNGISLEGKVD
jgi:transketolase